MRLLLLLLGGAPATALLTAPAASTRHITRAPPLRAPSITAAAPADRPDPPEGAPRDEPSRALREYLQRRGKGASLRFALTQAGPLRRGVAAIDELGGRLAAVLRFYRGALLVVPVHQALLLLTLAAYGAQSAAGRAAVAAGARLNLAILRGGQWHRLLTPIFLHGSAYHLASNLFSLWRVGPLAEGFYGGARTLLLYLLAGVGGNAAGLAFGSPRAMSVGASGAVLGLMGAVAAYVAVNRRQLGRSGDALLSQVGQLLLLNLLVGMGPRSGIDNLGHLGGAATGFALGCLLAPRASKQGSVAGDGAIVPPPVARVMLGATLAATALSLRSGVQLALSLREVMR